MAKEIEYSVKKDIAFEKRNGRIIKLLKGDKITAKDIDNDMMLGGFLKDKSIVESKKATKTNDKLEALKLEATELGIKFMANIGIVKLQAKVDEAKEGKV